MDEQRAHIPTDSVEASPPSGGAPRRRLRLRRVADQLPTKWFGAVVTAGVLIATAAFGGLAKAPTPALASIQPGEEHSGEQMSIKIEQLLLVDAIDELTYQISLEPGDRIVILVATVRNDWTQPISTDDTVLSVSDRPITTIAAAATDGTDSAVSAPSADDAPLVQLDSVVDAALVRTEDATTVMQLQPGLAVRVAYLWVVDQETATMVANGDELTVTISDPTLRSYTIVKDADPYWADPTPAATVKMVPEVRDSVSLAALGESG